MTKLIGVQAITGIPTKRDLLLVDEIQIRELDTASQLEPEVEATLSYLREEKLISSTPPARDFEKIADASGVDISPIQELAAEEHSKLLSHLEKKGWTKGQQFIATLQSHIDVETRIWAAIIRETQNVDAVPLIGRLSEWLPRLPTEQISQPQLQTVLEITLNTLPTPTDTVPFEKIIEFRQDEEAIRQSKLLRYWMRKIAKKNITAIEIEQELEHRLHKYEDYMNVHKIEFKRETFRTILKIPFEILENVVKLRFTSMVDTLFSISEQRLQLLKAELNAPHREVAFISHVKEIYKNK